MIGVFIDSSDLVAASGSKTGASALVLGYSRSGQIPDQKRQKSPTDRDHHQILRPLIGQLLAGVAKLSALDVYAALMTSLTEEDMKEVEAIGDDEAAKKRMEELFRERSGMTVDEMVQKVQEGFAEGYIKAGASSS